MGLKEIMEEIENTKDECELKIWKLIEKENELKWELLRVRNRLSDCNGTRTHNHLVCKRTPNHLAKLAK